MAAGNSLFGTEKDALPIIQAGGMLFVVTLLATALPGRGSAPDAAQSTSQITYNIEYARPDGVPLLLGAAIPNGKGPFPAAIIVHGGNWVEGSKTTHFGPLEPLLTGARYAWFSIEYRLPPKYRYPTPVEDVEAAVRWVRAHDEHCHVDPDRIVLIGESAGGYLVAVAGVEKQSITGVAAVIDFYGPSDLTIMAEYFSKPPKGVPEFFGITDFSGILTENSSRCFPSESRPSRNAAFLVHSRNGRPDCSLRFFPDHVRDDEERWSALPTRDGGGRRSRNGELGGQAALGKLEASDDRLAQRNAEDATEAVGLT